MYRGEINLEYMQVKASNDEIINEIVNRLYKKRATGIIKSENKIHFYGGILSGIIFNWCLLTGITKGIIVIENNKIQYSLSFIETYIFFGILAPIVSYAVLLKEQGMSSYMALFPIVFLLLVIFKTRVFWLLEIQNVS